MRATHIAQHIDIAAARFAKGEVFARDNSRNPKPFNEQCDDEIFGAGRRKFSIKIKHQHGVRACIFEKSLPLVERRQPEPRRLRREKADRMRVKGGNDSWTACRLRLRDGFTSDRLMPQMKAVEIAQSDDSTAQCVRHAVFGGKAGDCHMAKNRSPEQQSFCDCVRRKVALDLATPFDFSPTLRVDGSGLLFCLLVILQHSPWAPSQRG